MWSTSPVVEEALWRAARATLPARVLTGPALSGAVIERSLRYTSERDRLDTGSNGPSDLAARALFFTVSDAAKPLVPLAELDARGLLPAAGRLRVLDLGAGVGAMSLGLWMYMRGAGYDASLSVHAVDVDSAALDLMAAVVAELGDTGFEVRRQHSDLTTFSPDRGAYDLVLIGTALNELRGDAAHGVVSRALASLQPGGSLVIIEPALRGTARRLHELRDWAIDNSEATIYAPCTRRASPCPALADADDWCHEDRLTLLPPRARQLSRSTGLRRNGLKFAYLTLRRDGASQVEAPEVPLIALRVVSQPRKMKGRFEFFGCSESGRARLRLLKRNRTAANRVVERSSRGDVLVLRSATEIEGADEVLRSRLVPPVT